ncbi:MAG: large protein [Bacteroidota bacterium]|nr:large protein [Bacteroidota bacterium]
MDSCGFENTVEIRRMKIIKMDSSGCKKGILNISSVYKIDNIQRSFPPTRYFSVSGPTSFDVTDAVKTDSSVISVTGLQNGLYKYKITNACGDEVDDSFYYEKKCFSELSVHKFQSCNSLMFYLEKDCDIDTTVVYTLKDLNGHFIAQNSTGTFSNLSNDSCYEVGAHEYACDTTIYDTISPVRPLIRIFPNSCNEVSFAVSLQIKKQCGHGVIPKFYSVRDFVLMDSSFNILQTNTTGLVNPVPPKTYWIYARISDCNSDTVRYSPGRSFTDTMRFCITPSVRVSGSQCMFAWNVKLINNVKHTTYTLTGNGVNMQNAETFSGLDTGKYILKDGCSEQELYLPKYYNFISDVKAGCPSNALIIASAPVDSAYIDSIGNKYFFTVCDIPLMDYNIRVPGTNTLIAYNTSGVFPNLQNATTYDLIYKGDRNCNFFKKTITTPFYTRPSLTATYGLICNGNNATVKATVAGGTPPYTYEILNSATPQVITDSTFVIYNNLGLGTQQFRVSDVCGISTDYSTEVLSVDFQPTFKKKCNGQVELIAPDILNTTYTWTDKNGNVLGNTPIVYTYPTGDDTFTVVMHYLTCNISKSLFVADFSSSVVTAHAGIDYATDTTFANLQANLAINGAIGTWRQIAPSSGNSIFADIHDPKTRVTIDVFPGQYTYVWSIVDTAIHCISEDTVVVSYLPCPGILPIMYTKATRDASCSANGQIDITITQASNTVHYLWNTGDTTATLKNLKDSIYIVTISDETSCTPDIRDTTVIRATVPTFKNVSANICEGDSFIINNKKYSVQGNYSDTLVNSVGCDSILLIAINVLLKSESFDSAVRCSGEKYILQNGQTVTASGDYSVKLLNSVGCDSILYSHIIFNPVHQKNIDTTICAGLSFLLPGGSSVSQAGNYIDTLQNIFGCDSIVLTNLSVRDSLQNVYLGNDTTICEEDHILLTVSYPSYAKYLWQDNSTQPQFDISTEGIFYVKVYDGCTSTSDTINIQTMDCSCNFYVPTGFSPNNDGMNDVFLPFNRCVFFKDYSFSIFSRWGAEVFSTGDPASAWTGDYNNGTAQVDTYLWTLQYFDILRNQKITTKGTVTLIR